MFNRFILVLLLFVTGCATSVPTPIKKAVGKNAMVVTAHPLATQVGLEILNAGGNAVDAAVATHFALAVVYPRAGNLAGGGFAMIRTPDNEHLALDYRERAPEKSTKDMYLDDNGQPIPNASLAGGLAVGVPGSVAGMKELHEKFGSLSLEQCLKPSLILAKRGFKLTQEEAQRLNHYRPQFAEWNEEGTPFLGRSDFTTGDVLRQKMLAQTLADLSVNGLGSFYKPPMSKHIVNQIQKSGGIMNQKDLDDYTIRWRDPIAIPYKDYTLYSMPPPSSGGIALGQILMGLEGHVFHGFHSATDVHRIVESERRAFADRASFLGDPDYVEIPVDTLLAQKYIDRRMSDYTPEEATASGEVAAGGFDWSRESFETTHFCIAADGWVVSITTTLNGNYGSKVYVPELGIFLNNEMDDFSVKPGVPNQYGLLGSEANAIEPGKRMLSSMTPTIVDKGDSFFLALGTPGGSTIITSVAQVFLNVVEYEMSLLDAVASPRFHHQWWPDVIMHESSFPAKTLQELSKKGHNAKELRYIGLVEAIQQLPNGTYIGVADTRSEDHAAGN